MRPGLEWRSVSLPCLKIEVLSKRLGEMSSRVVGHVRLKGG